MTSGLNKPELLWDKYFHEICCTVSTKSLCLSRKIGAVLVRDKVIISTGYNGPPRGVPPCSERAHLDRLFSLELVRLNKPFKTLEECPRKFLGYDSGKGLEWCPATHAEVNAVINAARVGLPVLATTLYLNCLLPCRECTKVLVNAGIQEVVCESLSPYDRYSDYLREFSSIHFRTFTHLKMENT